MFCCVECKISLFGIQISVDCTCRSYQPWEPANNRGHQLHCDLDLGPCDLWWPGLLSVQHKPQRNQHNVPSVCLTCSISKCFSCVEKKVKNLNIEISTLKLSVCENWGSAYNANNRYLVPQYHMGKFFVWISIYSKICIYFADWITFFPGFNSMITSISAANKTIQTWDVWPLLTWSLVRTTQSGFVQPNRRSSALPYQPSSSPVCLLTWFTFVIHCL